MGEETGRKVVRALSKTVSYALIAILCISLVMGCYALWDSHMVHEHASAEQWKPYKPTEPEPLSFWELQRINPEVKAWLSVYGTNIDYPVCQATKEAEDKYVTTNAKGEHSLSGALFIDVANAADFSDFSTIVYGHHMENDVMFGPITDFMDKEFFDAHRYGNLFANDTDYGLEFFCIMDADAYDTSIYRNVFVDDSAKEDYLALLRERALHWRDDVEVHADDRIVLLSTCTAGYTNAREILVGKICDERFKNPFVKYPNEGTGVDMPEGWLGVPYWCWLALAALVVLVAIIVWSRKKTRTDE